jgi:hypothetical protein
MAVAHQIVTGFSRTEGTSVPLRERLPSLLAIVIFLGAVTLILCRGLENLNIPGHPDGTRYALQDFRDTVYYPVVALLDGANPYDPAFYLSHYPVGRPLPPYAPLNLLVHFPFALLPFESAELAYSAFAAMLTLLLARLTWKFSGRSARASHVFGLAALILLSRPGQMNLLLGQVALQCVIAAYIALFFARSRPWLAGFGLAVSTFKPTFGLPLAVLMLCRSDVRAVAIGLGTATVLSGALAGLLVHIAGGVAPFITSLLVSHQRFMQQSFNDVLSGPFRIDTAALVARLFSSNLGNVVEVLIGLAVLSVGAFAVWRVADTESEAAGARPVSATLICLTVLACTYHQAYDLLLLTLPVTALAADLWIPRRAAQPLLRWVLLGLLLLPAVNYLATATAIERLHVGAGCERVVTSLNAAAVLLAFALYAWLALRPRRVTTARSIRP